MTQSNASKKEQDSQELIHLAKRLEDLEQTGIDGAQFFEVAIGETVIGFIHQNELKNYLELHSDEYANLCVRKLGQETWMPASQHAFLQRRRPKIIKDNEISTDERFFYLKEGQKMGPFTINELKQKIDHKEILITEMIVPEKGGNWFKLFELEQFDRRLYGVRGQLPERPSEERFEFEQSLIKENSPEKEAIAGLAYIGQIKTTRPSTAPTEHAAIKEKETSSFVAEMPKASDESFKSFMKMAIGAIVILSLGWFAVQKFKTYRTTSATSTTEKNNIDAPLLKPSNRIPNGERRPQLRPNTVNTLRRATPPSIKDSKTFKNNQERLLNFDQGKDPAENDPIRDQLSQETLSSPPVTEGQGQSPEATAAEATSQAPAPGQEGTTWTSPENVKPNPQADNPFDGEVNN